MVQKRLVVIGGGTGSSVLLSGLKAFPVELTAIVPVTDDGGSTGRLVDEFGFLPVGDIRQCLAALSADNSHLKQLLLYRFDKGQGLIGHNLGNLILTAMEDIVGSEPEAVVETAKIFRLKGRVIPIAKQLVQLVAKYSSGKIIVSEHLIETHKLTRDEKIVKLSTQPKVAINPDAAEAMAQADWIIFAPGDLYNSIVANLVIDGVKAAIQATKAKLVYAMNLMTLNSQTAYFSARDHVRTIESYGGRELDHLILNNQPIPAAIQALYQQEQEYPVSDDLGKDPRVIRRPLLADGAYHKPSSDALKRSLLRHDPEKLAREIINLVNR